jgi:hypothetical protein
MDRLLGEIASALAVRQRNAAALERLYKELEKTRSVSMERLREGLDSISPAVFVHVMDSLFVRRGSASGEGGARQRATNAAAGKLEVGAFKCAPRPAAHEQPARR